MSNNADQNPGDPGNPKPMTVARRFLIEGHLQGVFFREWVVAKARETGVTGWVRNLRDGRVEVYAIGEKTVLDLFMKHLHNGSPASIVQSVQSELADVETVNGFTRRQTG